MRMRIFGEKPQEPDVTLRLKPSVDGEGVILVACNSAGEVMSGGYLLILETDGQIVLCENVNRHLGFDLDSKGRIRLKARPGF